MYLFQMLPELVSPIQELLEEAGLTAQDIKKVTTLGGNSQITSCKIVDTLPLPLSQLNVSLTWAFKHRGTKMCNKLYPSCVTF